MTKIYTNTPTWENLPERIEERIVIDTDTGCHIWIGTYDLGRRPIMNFTCELKNKSAATGAWIVANGEVPDGMTARPTVCGNRQCVHPDHLTLVKGRTAFYKNRARGERCRTNVLTEQQVRDILKDPRPNGEIAQDYPCTAENIWAIKQRKSWKHIQPGTGSDPDV